ncbi:MAG: hypothetical protein R3240_07425 [Gammaproteobacteria bacterium]|nr:hypothetical protein [Gammaproteobacteria bacterium]
MANIRISIALLMLFVLLTACSHSNSHSEEEKHLPFLAAQDSLQVFSSQSKSYQPLFMTGINLGVGIPGTYAGELAASREQYESWLQLMADAGINSLRIYTLHFPRFYEVLNTFNEQRIAKGLQPIYLLQGIWLDEELVNPDQSDLYNMTDSFQTSVEQVIDAVHGNISIPHRYGEAYGDFTVDASPWVLGYILGREVSPQEIAYTNAQNTTKTSFAGDALSIAIATPAEAWVTEQMNYAILYERENYQTERPISFTSWPTLDPLIHPTETSFEDSEQLDLANINTDLAPAGIFYSFHAYPYYPDFISEEGNYRAYSDADGANSYLGYLTALKAHYNKRPLLIAEFGVPSSWGNIHSAHSGMHHGGHSENEQGVYVARMLKNLQQTNTAGGMLFAMIDEWWKPTWLTNEFDFPFNRRAYWHNVLAPEQNYGLLAFDSARSSATPLKKSNGSNWSNNTVLVPVVSYDAAFLYIDLTLNDISSLQKLDLAFDTYDDTLGEHVFPSSSANGVSTQFGYEFTLSLVKSGQGYSAQMYVTEAYDLYGLWNEEQDPATQKLQSVESYSGKWNPIIWKTNYTPYPDPKSSDTFYGYTENTQFNIGALKIGEGSDFQASNEAIAIDGNQLQIRIPWGLLQITDPARQQVFHDLPETTLRDSLSTAGIRLGIVVNNQLQGETERYLWPGWTDINDMPAVTERIKPAYYAYKQAISSLTSN